MLSGNRTDAGMKRPAAIATKSGSADTRAATGTTVNNPGIRRYRDNAWPLSSNDARGWRSALLGL